MSGENRKSFLSYSLPKSMGAFFRELSAVTLLLLLQERVWAYDFFTPGLVLFLILISHRVPYINSYAFLFEFLCIDDWREPNHVGLQKHADISQNPFHGALVLAAHILAAISAAALRVYFDVTFGREIISASPGIVPALQVDVDGLHKFDSFWYATPHIIRLKDEMIWMVILPLHAGHNLGIDRMAIVSWYVTEEIGYTFLLCVCYIHIRLSAGVGVDKRSPTNPFKRAYWQALIKMCRSVMLTLVYMALYRAFPTAHGSLHMSIYKCQYQAWNPNVIVYDSDNGEIFARIVGGLFGMGLSVAYNRMLVGTERVNEADDGDLYYRLIWGMDPDPVHTREARVGRQPRAKTPEWTDGYTGYGPAVAIVAATCGNCGDCNTCNSQLSARKQLKLPPTLNHSR